MFNDDHLPFMSSMTGAAEVNVYPSKIMHSALFDGVDDYLSLTPTASASDRKRFTLNFAIKRANKGDVNNNRTIISAGAASTESTVIQFQSNTEKIEFLSSTGGAVRLHVLTDSMFVDETHHTHIHIEFDSTQVLARDRCKIWSNGKRVSVTSLTEVPLNFTSFIGHTTLHTIGKNSAVDASYLGGYLSNLRLIMSAIVPCTTFGEQSGFVSGLWVPREPGAIQYGVNGCWLNFANAAALGAEVSGNGNDWTVNGSPAQTLDTPTSNYCVLNSLDPTTTGTLSNGNTTVIGGNARVTMQPDRGKWSYRKNGIEQLFDAEVSGRFNPTLTDGTYDFGASGYTPTEGYLTLCTASIPTPVVLKSSLVADLITRVGTGANVSVEGLGFSPDWVDIKCRNTTWYWLVNDSVRGAGRSLYTNTNDVEGVGSTMLSAFTGDGYLLGTDNNVNAHNDTFLDLCLKAGRNQGFEIVTYTGDGVAGRQLSHSLGKAPTFMLVKNRFSAWDWSVYHVALGANKRLRLNDTTVVDTSSAYWNNNAPNATHVTLGTDGSTNASGIDYVAYLFTDSDIFKAFSYVGNGSTNGPFINLGGRPLVIPFWKNSAATDNWRNVDSVRNPHNPISAYLCPNSSGAEATYPSGRFTSNGVKIVDSGAALNGVGNLHVGLAILESTQYANAY